MKGLELGHEGRTCREKSLEVVPGGKQTWGIGRTSLVAEDETSVYGRDSGKQEENLTQFLLKKNLAGGWYNMALGSFSRFDSQQCYSLAP